jgi:hypothetical protein
VVRRLGFSAMTSPSYDWVAHHAVVRGDKVAAHDLASERKILKRELRDLYGQP